MRNLYLKYRYELIVGVAGALVMVIELVGARIVAPYLGTSMYVWTALIGVILAALSIGNYYGGRLADDHPSDEKLMKIVTIAVCALLLMLFVRDSVLTILTGSGIDVRLSAVMVSIVLFAIPAALLGVVSPYVAKLRLMKSKHVGASIGRLYAAGTVGSIIGTFATGYWLVAWLGNTTLSVLVTGALLALTVAISTRGFVGIRLILAGIIALSFFMLNRSTQGDVVGDIDTSYARYQIVDVPGDQKVRYLITDPDTAQSGQYVDKPDELVFQYLKAFRSTLDDKEIDRLTVIGGGIFTFPRAVANEFPDAEVVAVEIDPRLEEIAERYFGHVRPDNLDIVVEDGRAYLNQLPGDGPKNNVLFVDAFSSRTPPYQLMTTQAVEKMKRSITQNGIVAVNLIAAVEQNDYLDAVTATYRSQFAHVDVLKVYEDIPDEQVQNLVIIASNDKASSAKAVNATKLSSVNTGRASAFTDDFAPVEQLLFSSF